MVQSYCNAVVELLSLHINEYYDEPPLDRIYVPQLTFPLPGPPYFRILDLPVEIQCEILEHAINPWSLEIMLKHTSIKCRKWRTLKLVSYHRHAATLSISEEVSKVLQLFKIHPQLWDAVSRVVRKNYQGVAHIHSEKDCARAAMCNWRLPASIREIVQQGTKRLHIRGLFPTKRAREVFPKAQSVIYHPGSFPFRAWADWPLSADYRELHSGVWDRRFIIAANNYVSCMNQFELGGSHTADDNAVGVSYRAHIQESCWRGDWHHRNDAIVNVRMMDGEFYVASRRVVAKDVAPESEAVVRWEFAGNCKLMNKRVLRTLIKEAMFREETSRERGWMAFIRGWFLSNCPPNAEVVD